MLGPGLPAALIGAGEIHVHCDLNDAAFGQAAGRASAYGEDVQVHSVATRSASPGQAQHRQPTLSKTDNAGSGALPIPSLNAVRTRVERERRVGEGNGAAALGVEAQAFAPQFRGRRRVSVRRPIASPPEWP
jgi:hypothetical protein